MATEITAYLVTDNHGFKKVVLSNTSTSYIFNVVAKFLKDVYDINEDEIKSELYITNLSNKWKYLRLQGTFEEIDIVM